MSSESKNLADSLRPLAKSLCSGTALAVGYWFLASLAAPAAGFRELGPEAWPGAELFTNGALHAFQIEVPDQEMEHLRKDSREFVHARISAGGVVYEDVGIHLKGSVGSFRPLDDKPGLTLDFCRFKADRKFHGLRRIHLNNSVEDPSYLNEKLGSELFLAAGVPAPRVAHARVTLNGRKLGLYVLKEGFTEDFLSCHFKHISGDLFEPDEGHDVDQRMKRNSVQAPRTGRAGVEELAAAAVEPDLEKRWQRLQAALDLDRFLPFLAMEVMVCHRDGYCLARNNFRVYHDLDTDKVVFFPHGMDQLLGRAELPRQPRMGGLVARALLETPEGKEAYVRCFGLLFTNLFKSELLNQRVDGIVSELGASLTTSEFAGIRTEAALLKNRITAREAQLRSQLNQPKPELLKFAGGYAQLQGWSKGAELADGKMDLADASDGKPCLHILLQAETAAAWRTQALLARGSYRFEGRAKIAKVKPLPYGKHQGAGLRIGGHVRSSVDLVGDSSWQTLRADFDVEQPCEEVEFVCELRASAGEAWFDRDSLRVAQLER